MELNYINPPDNAGGAAVPGCGTIHKSEVQPTLTSLSADLNFQFNLNDYILASTGKRTYSGDIDLVLDIAQYDRSPVEFYGTLVALFGKDNTARNGAMVHLKYPITGYDASLQGSTPRTGFVQVDFNFGNAAWERIYHYSPGEDSAYKGAHRNLSISALCSALAISSKELDTFDRPIISERWKWGSNGLIKVIRCGVKSSETGEWHRKQLDAIIEGPYCDIEKIASILFPKDGVPSDLHSLESIIDAVKRNFDDVIQARVWKRMAYNFYQWKDGKNFVYPPEVTAYLIQNDK